MALLPESGVVPYTLPDDQPSASDDHIAWHYQTNKKTNDLGFNPRSDYGAPCDGVSDDLPAIELALADMATAIAAGKRATLILGGHTYLLSARLQPRELIGFRIMGDGALVLGQDGDSAVCQPFHCEQFKIEGVTFMHESVGTRNASGDGLNPLACDDFDIEDCSVPYSRSIGIRPQASSNGVVRGCNVSDTEADGIGCYMGFRAGTAAITSGDNTLTTAGDDSLLTQAAVGTEVIIQGAGPAAAALITFIVSVTDSRHAELRDAAGTTVTTAALKLVRACSDVRFTGNWAKNTGDDSFSIVSNAIIGSDVIDSICSDIIISGNHSRGSLARGVAVAGATGFVVSGNTVVESVVHGIHAQYDGTPYTHGVANGVVGGNTLRACGSAGHHQISVGSLSTSHKATNIAVTNNAIAGGPCGYILIGGGSDGTENITVTDNVCEGGVQTNHGIFADNVVSPTIRGNTVNSAGLACVATSNSGGVARVQDNNCYAPGGGFPGIFVGDALAIVTGNYTDGLDTSAVTDPDSIIDNNINF